MILFLGTEYTEPKVDNLARVTGENPDKLVYPHDVDHVFVFYCVTLYLIATPRKCAIHIYVKRGF